MASSARFFFLHAVWAALFVAACSGDGATNSSSGQGGVACSTDAQCAASGECKTASCVNGVCVEELAPAGKLVFAGLVPGDCKRKQCAADGSILDMVDDTDKPDDHNPCTVDACVMGVPMHTTDTSKEGMACGTGAQAKCLSGACSGCASDAECPQGGPCDTAICSALAAGMAKQCGFKPAATGTVVSNVDPTDCFQAVCDANGLVVSIPAPMEMPPPDENDCDVELCSATGNIVHTSQPEGTACGGSTDCAPRTCTSGMCVTQPFVPAGMAAPTQTAGDCKRVVCDGMGGWMSQSDVNDPPADANMGDCVKPTCGPTGPSMMNVPAGTTCAGGTTGVCDGNGTCT